MLNMKNILIRWAWIVMLMVFPVHQVLAETTMDQMQARQDTLGHPFSYLESRIDTHQIYLDLRNLPDRANVVLGTINFRDLDLRDLLRGIGREYELNLLVDNQINKRSTVRLANIAVIEALIYICLEYDLSLHQNGQIFRIRNYLPEEKVPEIKIPDVQINEQGLIFLDLANDDLSLTIRTMSQMTGQNIIVRSGVSGSLTGYLQSVPFEVGLETILNNNGFTLRKRDEIWFVDRGGIRLGGEQPSGEQQTLWVQAVDNLISLDVTNAPLVDVIREIGYQLDLNLVTYSLPQGVITAKTKNLTLDHTFSYLFRGTNYTFRQESDIYVIGDKNISGIATTRLMRFNHIRADVVLDMIPANLIQGATIKIVKEQNGILAIGTNDMLMDLEAFIREIDYPTPQILIEALVVDVQTSNIFELGATLAGSFRPDSLFGIPRILFGSETQRGRFSGGVSIDGDGRHVNSLLAAGGNLFGIQNLGVLPRDFFFRIHALDQKGVVNIRSRPQISTLNGHEASIEIGTKQYYLLRTTTPIRSPQDVITQESERFETIEANVSLKITPWVSASGEVTTEIRPEFNTPVGEFNPNVPPTINSRVLDSTVRLKDGETIILGGLIQESEINFKNRIPIIGRIPLLGRLFTNTTKSTVKSELIIFITPHVFYGDENDYLRWERLRDDLSY